MQIEEAVSEAETGLDQGPPGLDATNSVDTQAPSMLEGLDGGGRACPEQTLGVRRTGQAGFVQPVLKVGDGRSLVARSQREDGRRKSRN
jgi:hypothetical protein